MTQRPTFNFPAFVALSDAPSDPKAAARALRIAAGFLRRGEPLPPALAAHVASAFERAAAAPERKRIRELALGLSLTTAGRRPLINPIELGSAVDALMYKGRGESEAAAIDATATAYAVDLATVRRALAKYRRALAKADRE